MADQSQVVQQLYDCGTPLVQRIDLQKKYGTRDLTRWFLDLVRPSSHDTVLDIGCGNGHHLLAFAPLVRLAVGIDISQELLNAARTRAQEESLGNVHLIHGMGERLSFLKQKFTIIMCNFAIYYMDAQKVFHQVASYLTSEGRAYIMGSPDENARELLDLHTSICDYIPVTYTLGYSDVHKYRSLMLQYFRYYSFNRFINPVNFPTVEEFLAYYQSTTLYQLACGVDPQLLEKMAQKAREVFQREGFIRVTKVVDTAELRAPNKTSLGEVEWEPRR